MSFRNLLLVLTLFSMSLWVNAQEALTGTISLRDAFEAVMQSNPRLRSFQFREEALLGQRESADLNPPLRANGGIEEFLGSGNLQDFSATELNIGLSQVIELGGKRQARLGVANRRIDLLAAQQRVVELDLLGETTQRFIDVVAAQELLELQRRATEIANQTIELLEPLVAAGRSPQLEQDPRPLKPWLWLCWTAPASVCRQCGPSASHSSIQWTPICLRSVLPGHCKPYCRIWIPIRTLRSMAVKNACMKLNCDRPTQCNRAILNGLPGFAIFGS